MSATPRPEPPALPVPDAQPHTPSAPSKAPSAAVDFLQATQEQMRAMYLMLPDPAGLSRVADGMYLEVNPAFCAFTGLAREDILGRTSIELNIWANQHERDKLVHTLLRDGKVENLELLARAKGELVPGTMSALPVNIQGEECLVFAFHDMRHELEIREELEAKSSALDQAGRIAKLGYWVDEHGKGLVYWSDTCYDIHGLPRGAPLPTDYISTFVVPGWRDAMRQAIRNCVQHHRPWNMVVQIQRADGSLIWGRVRGEPVVENGRVLRIRGVMQDIDERQRSEERLRQSEERLTRFFQLLPYPMGLSLRTTGAYLDVNPAWEEAFGYTRQEVMGKTAVELGILSPQTREKLITHANASERLNAYELEVTLRSGAKRTGLQSMRAVDFDEQACWLFAWQDITDRKHEETQVREREALLSLTLATAALGRWDWNVHTGMINGDERWRSLHKLPAGDITSPALLWTDRLDPEEVLRVSTEITRHIHQPETPFDVTFCIRRPHEKDRWVRNQGKVVSLDADGQPLRMLGIAMDVTSQHEQETLLRRLAHYDTLTGLPNRVMFARKLSDAMDQALEQDALLGVAYLDLDGFKPVNDRLGHDAGDRLLVIAAQRLSRALRPQDCVARLGGDEFAILLPTLAHVQECRQLLTQAMQSLAAPYQIGSHRVSVTASIGFTLYPQDDSDADALLRHADQAMYAAKQAGRNRLHEFDLTQEHQSRQVREQIQRLRQALLQGEFELFLQPKVDMRQGTVVGAEALARWRHPEQGVLAPGAFLPQIEGTELEVPFGAWVLQAGLQLANSLQAQGLRLPISVNISATHLQQPGFAQWMKAEIRRTNDVAPTLLELEITETAALYHLEPVAQTLGELRQLGVGVALDDFGTGYSSLTYLRRLPLSTLKIDQSFVHGMMDDAGDLAIVQGVIGLARSFGYQVIAEGVETVDQGQILEQLGCPQAQGYYIARPMPLADFIAWSRTWQCPPEWRK